MLIGLVQWFDAQKGFGVIGTPEEGEFFLHINNFIDKPQSIPKGTAIIFEKKVDLKKNRNIAGDCRFIGENDDWEIILNYLGKPDSISIEIEVAASGIRGKHYLQKKSFSLMEVAALQFLIGKNESELSTMIIGYFDDTLNEKYFVQYCEFIEKITKTIEKDKATTLLNEFYTHFGDNLNETILFYTWKSKKFKYIGYFDANEYEIPENVYQSFFCEIGVLELKRIKGYEFGVAFCDKFIKAKFAELKRLSAEEIIDLYPFLEFSMELEREDYKLQLDKLYSEKVLIEIIEQAKQIETVKAKDDFYKFDNLRKLIPAQISKEEKTRLNDAINNIIVQKCPEEFKIELWIKGFIAEVSIDFITEIFLDNETQMGKRAVILSKLQLDQQFQLLKTYTENNNWVHAFFVLEELVKIENSLGYGFHLSKNLFDIEFWKENNSSELVSLFSQFANDNTTGEEKYELFFKGLINDVPKSLVKQNIDRFGEVECEILFSCNPANESFILEILFAKISKENIHDLAWIYDLGNKFLNAANFILLDQKVFNSIDQLNYYNLWMKGKAKNLPKEYIEELLNDKYEFYSEIDKWIATKVISQDEITTILLEYLEKQAPVTDRMIFYRQYNHIKYLLKSDESNLNKIKQQKNDFYQIILWSLGKENSLDFELLKLKFIYFSPEEQVKILRKLFSLKVKNEFEFTIEKLNELTRIDLDLYKNNLHFNPTIPLDISTDVILKSLLNYIHNRNFLVESDLLSIVLKDLKDDKTRRFKFAHYFETCKGREKATFNWASNGEIRKVKFGENQFYFSIEFKYDSGLVERVKTIPGKKWNGEAKRWEVPSNYENEVLKFAEKNKFYLDFEGSNYVNNTHLAEFSRSEIPNGISFCEGRLANRPHEMFKKNFYWCTGQPCFEKCETIHKENEWEKYTLLDFCEILKLNTDETNRFGAFVPKGHYYQFMGLINRFNKLLEKIYCTECNEILHPVETGNFAAHAVVRFCCENSDCGLYKQKVYLNHCLNGQCNGIIDSRVSEKCSNGLYICDSCGSCCSHEMLERRLNNLQTVGGYIHSNLTNCVNEKLGHLERAEYFCFKCQKLMYETKPDVFHCNDCKITYDTTKYNFKRPNRHLNTTNNEKPD